MKMHDLNQLISLSREYNKQIIGLAIDRRIGGRTGGSEQLQMLGSSEAAKKLGLARSQVSRSVFKRAAHIPRGMQA